MESMVTAREGLSKWLCVCMCVCQSQRSRERMGVDMKKCWPVVQLDYSLEVFASDYDGIDAIRGRNGQHDRLWDTVFSVEVLVLNYIDDLFKL